MRLFSENLITKIFNISETTSLGHPVNDKYGYLSRLGQLWLSIIIYTSEFIIIYTTLRVLVFTNNLWNPFNKYQFVLFHIVYKPIRSFRNYYSIYTAHVSTSIF